MQSIKPKAEIQKKRLEIIGLLSLAKVHNRSLHEIEKVLMEMTGEEEYGHVGDMVWGEIENHEPEKSYKDLLEKLDYAREREEVK